MVSHKLHIKANLLHAQIEIIAKVARRLINLARPERGKRVAIVQNFVAHRNCDLCGTAGDTQMGIG